MLKKILLNLIIVLNLISCKGQENGEIAELYKIPKEFITVLKTKDDNELKKFCSSLVFNNQTLSLMRKYGFCYKGVPCRMDEKGYDIQYVINKYYEKFLDLRNSLDNRGFLDSLTTIDTINYKIENQILSGAFNKKTKKPIAIPTYLNEYNNENVKRIDSILKFKKVDRVSINGSYLSISEYLAFKKHRAKLKEVCDVARINLKMTRMNIILKSGNHLFKYNMGLMASLKNAKWSLVTAPEKYFQDMKEQSFYSRQKLELLSKQKKKNKKKN